MKPMPDLHNRELLLLYCHASKCKRVRQLKIVELSKNGMRLQCPTCHRETIVAREDYIQSESEIAVVYQREMGFKIGQNLFHSKFNDHGFVVGKAHNVIYVNFIQNGMKMLAHDHVGH